jgi:hypothetical protein
MKAISQYLALFFCAVVTLISCGNSGNSGSSDLDNSSSSHGQQGNGVCYTTPFIGIDISFCSKYKNNTNVNSTDCKNIGSQTGYPTEWREACPTDHELICDRTEATIYVYGAAVVNYGRDCDRIFGPSPSSSSGQQLSSSSGQQESGVCYTTPNEGVDFSFCLKYKTTVIVTEAVCKEQGYPTWMEACPSGQKLICERTAATIYVYGAAVASIFDNDCNKIFEN